MSADLEVQISESIDYIDQQIRELQEEIGRLSEKKRGLVDQRNKIKDQKSIKKSLELANKDWENENFSWSKTVRTVLKETFKMTEFRPQQLRTINAVLNKHDVILIAPTGGGKSLCFQLPALVSKGLTVVVSPLISLMEDQIENLKKFKIEAAALNVSTDKAMEKNIYTKLTYHDEVNPLKLLYVTPERMGKSKRFMSALQKCYFANRLDRFAIDEVHCCSQWGHDFRPDYKFLGSLKTTFPNVPILGVTATATTKVTVDVQKMLSIRHSLVINAPFNRPNLFYQVMEKPSEKQATAELIANLMKSRYRGMSGIIYTFSIKDTEDLAASLLNLDVKVRPYHGSLDNENRSRIHKKWLSNQIQAVVATVAFGMGIDKPDVRFVIHHTMSKSMENFYQESGRAGRDGKPAECLLFYRLQDLFKISTMMFSEYTGLKNAYEMLKYCVNGHQCRREIISKYFAEVWKDNDCNKMCDRCFYQSQAKSPEISIATYINEVQSIVKAAQNLDINLTAIKLIDAWYGKGPSTLRLKDIPVPSIDRSYVEQIIAHCLVEGYLEEDFHYTAYKANSYLKLGSKSVHGDESLKLNRTRYLDLPPKETIMQETTSSNEDDLIFVSQTPPSKKSKSKKKKSKERDSSSEGDKVKRKKKRRSSHSESTSSSLVIKEEIVLDDEFEIVDDKSVYIELE